MKIINVGNRIMNTYLYRIDDGYVMIDTGYENSYKTVLKQLRRHFIDPREIKYVFLTHAHDDHAGFLKELLDDYPKITVIMDEKAIPVLQRGQNSFEGGCSGIIAFLFCQFMRWMGKGAHRFPALDASYLDRFLVISHDSHERKADIESVLKGEILFTPGHTADSISLMLGEKIICGDAAMNGFPSRKRITIWIGNRQDFLESWKILIKTSANVLLPAHGKSFSKEDLRKNIEFLDKIRLYTLSDA